jgi:hydrogenase/urease accessory protein HupE
MPSFLLTRIRGFAAPLLIGGFWCGFWWAFPAPLSAHIMSMSSGHLVVEGSVAEYELRMPLYEIVHLEEPEKSLLENFRLYQEGREVSAAEASCRANPDEGVYLCRAKFVFPEPVDQLDVECTFAAVTVPNHVHILRATRGEVTAQAVFDFTFSRSTIRFIPPTVLEELLSQMGAGGLRVLAGPLQILFLVALVLAGRNKRELRWLAAAFVLAEVVAALVVVWKPWQPPARFVEAAAALTVAYLAVEILALPEAGYRWLIAGGMGVFHGFYFGTFLRQSEMDSLYVLSGVVIADLALLALFAYMLSRLTRAAPWLRPVRSGAVVLLLVGMVWFVLRMRS